MILTCLEPKENHVYDMFKDMQHVEISDALMDFLEAIYLKYGKTKIALGASLMLNRTWNMSRDSLTQNYFKWDQLLSMK